MLAGYTMLDLTVLDLNVETAQTIDGVGARLTAAEAPQYADRRARRCQ